MASPPRGRSPAVPAEGRAPSRSNSPIAAITRGGVSDNIPRGVELPSSAYGSMSSMSSSKEEDDLAPIQRIGVDEVTYSLASMALGNNAIAYVDQKHHPHKQAAFMRRNITYFGNADEEWKQYSTKYGMPGRPGFNKSGQDIIMGLNAYHVTKLPDVMVYQYDVTIGKGNEKRGLIKAVWESGTLQKLLGPHWLFDGNKIAWSIKGIASMSNTAIDRQMLSHSIDMDLERGGAGLAARNALVNKTNRPQKEPRDNTHRVQVRYAGKVNLAVLESYAKGEMAFDDNILQAVNFLSHLMRHTPSKNLITLKNSFFPTNWNNAYALWGGLYAIKGVFQSIRIAQGAKMIVNVDVSHACFIQNRRMDVIAQALADHAPSAAAIIAYVQKHQKDPPYGAYRESPLMDKLRRLRKVSFTVNYRNVSDRIKGKRWIVKDIMYTNAKNTYFDVNNHETGEKKRMNVEEYFEQQYGFRLENPLMPLIETTKKGVMYPMEVCFVETGNRWPFKLNEKQTADMIKFAVSRPDDRMRGIQNGLSALNWKGDQTMKAYGLQISDRLIETKAKLLKPPNVMFHNRVTESPGTSGRWRIDKKKFYRPNSKPLESWGVCLITGRGKSASQQEVMNFLRDFMNNYRQYGGNIQNPSPALFQHGDDNPEAAVDGAHASCARRSGGIKPQFILFVLPRKEAFLYNQLKRHCDLKYGIVSQMVQSQHVQRNQAQYIGNVLMKLNAKLGGQSFKAVPLQGPVANRNGAYFGKPTMIIGADVSHPAPGMVKPSYAAVTVSMDRDAIRYGAAVQSNGHRLEMITSWNWQDMLGPLLREWKSAVGAGQLPQHVIYFRDGVSEGQFQHIIHQEVRDIRNTFKEHDDSAGKSAVQKLTFTVVVASKRHHIRFFPKGGPGMDRNKNPCPGVIVERDVTSPHDHDFYLCSHSAIQGTARPCHYTVIMDQENVEPTFLHNMIYEHCYQYIRSSTPVSIYPAIYYAHLAARRAAAHERTQEGPLKQHRSSEQRERELLMRAKGEADQTGKVMTREAVAKLKYYMNEDFPPLHPTCDETFWHKMWYI